MNAEHICECELPAYVNETAYRKFKTRSLSHKCLVCKLKGMVLSAAKHVCVVHADECLCAASMVRTAHNHNLNKLLSVIRCAHHVQHRCKAMHEG